MNPMIQRGRAAFVLVLSFLTAFPAPAQAGSDEEKELRKRVEEATVAVKAEEERVTRLKKTLEKEFSAFGDETRFRAFCAAMDGAAEGFRAALGNGDADRAKKEFVEAVRTIVRDKVGREMVRFIADDLAGNLVEALGEPASGGLATAIREYLDLKFQLQDPFEQNFKLVFEPLVTEALRKAMLVRDEAEQNLASARAARSAGGTMVAGMIPVPGGDHVIGLDEAELMGLSKTLGYDLERLIYAYPGTPAHKVTLAPFFLSQNEVTNLEYWTFCEATGVKKRPSYWGKDGRFPAGYENRPVVKITYDDAEAYCAWVGRRLPTEAEWEAAARNPGTSDGGRPRIFPWGNTWPRGAVPCNFSGNAARDREIASLAAGLPGVVSVGKFTEFRSALGFNDLAGNAAEWTSSPFVPYPGFKPKKFGTTSLDSGFFNETHMVVRGGNFVQNDYSMLATWRNSLDPRNASERVGFRTARSLEPGRDAIFRLAGEHRLDAALVDYPVLPAEARAGRKAPEVEVDDARLFFGLVADDWDATKNIPGPSRSLVLSCRRTDAFTDIVSIRDAARKEATFLGILHTDVAIAKPELKPGTYAFIYRPAAGGKDARGGEKKQPDGFILRPIGVRDQEERVLDPCNVVKLPYPPRTKILANATREEFECVFALPVRSSPKHSLTLSFKLAAAPGTVARFR